MITVENLSVRYGGVEALNDVTFSAATGKVTAILGANGAGKTTLLRTITGLEKATSGTITYDERNLLGKRPEDISRMGVGHVPEGRAVITEFTVEENLRLGALASKVNLKDGLAEQYEQFPILGERRRQHASTLSGGERQMLAMARALIAKPKVLLLDEPSLGLAPLVTRSMMDKIAELCAGGELTVLLVEQNAKSALRIAHDAIVLSVGKLVACADATTVANDENLRHYYLGLVK